MRGTGAMALAVVAVVACRRGPPPVDDPDPDLRPAAPSPPVIADVDDCGGDCADFAVRLFEGRDVHADEAHAKRVIAATCPRHPHDCGEFGNLYMIGRGLPKNGERAFAFLDPACTAGDVESCGDLGSLYSVGMGVPVDQARAMSLWRIACDGGDHRFCGRIGRAMVEGDGMPLDPARGMPLIDEGCTGGDLDACIFEGAMYGRSQGPVPHDDARAVALFRKACDGGAALGCADLAAIAADPIAAAGLLRRACELGDQPSCK